MDIPAMLRICINTVASAVLMPGANIGFLLFLYILYLQYRKAVRMQEIIYGRPKVPLKQLMLTSVLAGIIAGIAISIPMMLMGISFNQDMGIQYLIPISFILMLIEPRFLCFSYSGGILALASLVFGLTWIDATGIMALVGLFHLLESVLIYFDGSRGAIPVFLDRGSGEVIGGFTMQRFWPIPVAIILFMGYGTAAGDVVPTPEWWPVIRPFIEPGRLQEALFTAVPLSAILGYGEFTSSYLPREKCRSSSYRLAVYSLCLLLLSVISSYVFAFKYIAALFAPLGHEFLIQHEKSKERKRESLFSPVTEGLRVLDTMPEGVGEKMGILPGEVILSVNNMNINSEDDLNRFFEQYVPYIWVDVKDRNGNTRTLEHKNYRDGINSLEVLIVPASSEGLITVKERKSFFKRLLKN